MDPRHPRAVAAGLPADDARLAAALEQAGFSLAGRAANGEAALGLIRELRPELVVCAAILPGMDGVALAQRVRRARLNAQPALLILKPRGLRLPGEDALAGLAATVVETPCGAQALAQAAAAALARPIPLPADKAARLEALMDALGVPRHPGRECLRIAVALAWADRRRLDSLKADLYPQTARQAGLQPAQAERAIRHVIDRAFRTGEIDQQHKIFGDTIDARRGKPTSGEMIAQLADILRWEG